MLSRRSFAGVPTLAAPLAIAASVHASLSRHCSRGMILYGHIGTLPRSSGVAVAERVFPVL